MRDTITEFRNGDQLVVNTDFRRIVNPPFSFQFNARKYYHFQDVHYSAFVPQRSIIKHLRTLDSSQTMQARLGSSFDRYIHDRFYAGFMKALVLGDKSELDKELRSAFSRTGLIHILAVSGLHVGILYLILHSIFDVLFGRLKMIKALLIVLSLITYAWLTGFAASVSRSVIMFSCMAIGLAISRKGHVLNSMCFSAFLVLLADPLQLFQLGFQLSYLAVTGIVILNPGVRKLLPVSGLFGGKLNDILSVSFSVQLATFPIDLLCVSPIPELLFAHQCTGLAIYTHFVGFWYRSDLFVLCPS